MAKEYGALGQEDRRRVMRPVDQHGRQFWGSGEAGKYGVFPSGPLLPDGWSAPWMPDMKYAVIDPNNPTVFRWDYEAQAKDLETAHDEYHKQALDHAIQNGWEIPEKGGPYSPQILRVIGPAPKPVEPVYAAMQGNSYVLGFSPTPDPRVTPFLRQKETRTALRSKYDFRDQTQPPATVVADEDELEGLLDLEEQYDSTASGGTRVAPRKRGSK